VMEGFLRWRVSPLARGLLTRAIALGPAVGCLLALGEKSSLDLLVATQLVLSLQLPFAIVPLLRLNASRAWMGRFAIRGAMKQSGWAIAICLVGANAWL